MTTLETETELQQKFDRFVKTTSNNCAVQLGRRYAARVAIIDNKDPEAPKHVTEKELFNSLEWQKLKEEKRIEGDEAYLDRLGNAFEARMSDITNYDTYVKAKKEGSKEEQNAAAARMYCMMEWQNIHAMVNDLGDVGIHVLAINTSMAATGNIIRSTNFHKYRIPRIMSNWDSIQTQNFKPTESFLKDHYERDAVAIGHMARHPLVVINNVIDSGITSVLEENAGTEHQIKEVRTNLIQVTVISKKEWERTGDYCSESLYSADAVMNIHTANQLTRKGNPVILSDATAQQWEKQIFEINGLEWKIVADYSENLYDIRRRGPMTEAIILSEDQSGNKELF